MAADPPRPGTTDAPLNESEAATLWSNQPSESFVTNEAYRAAYGEERTTLHELANGTAVTFTRPPDTAQRWTRHAHGTYTPGDRETSVYPPHADLAESRFIDDAHATVFALSPATKTHVAAADERLYVAPDGQLLGTIDYRIEVPEPTRSADRTVSWSVVDHEIAEVRVYADGTRVATTDGTHTPAVGYDLPPDTETVAFEADIEATLAKTVTEHDGNGAGETSQDSETNDERSTPTTSPARTEQVRGHERDDEPTASDRSAGTTTSTTRTTTTTTIEDSVTVRDELAVSVYDLEASTMHATTADGETGLVVFQSAPWQGVTVTDDGAHGVRGIWRFVTARQTAWDDLVHARRDGTERTDSDALPVYVHAYPSRLGPRAEPTFDGPSIVRTWSQGVTHDAPAASLPEHVDVAVRETAYEPTNGIALRAPRIDHNAVTIHGIVHGTDATITDLGAARHVRDSELSATIVDRNGSQAIVRLRLRDAETGEGIALEDGAATRAGQGDTGHIAIAGERVRTNASGEATVVLTDPGVYTARYEPASWLDTAPAYTADAAVVRWHPLGTIGGWLDLAVQTILVVAPLGVVWYAGRQLSSIVGGRWS